MYMCMNTHVDTGTYITYLTYKYICFSFYKSIPILPTNNVNNTRLENPKPRRRSECYSQVGLLGSGSAQYVDLPL